MTVLGWDGCRLLPLTVEAIVDERVVGVDSARIGAIPTGAARTRSTPLGVKKRVLRIRVPLSFTFTRRGLLAAAGFFRNTVILPFSGLLSRMSF